MPWSQKDVSGAIGGGSDGAVMSDGGTERSRIKYYTTSGLRKASTHEMTLAVATPVVRRCGKKRG